MPSNGYNVYQCDIGNVKWQKVTSEKSEIHLFYF